MKDNIEKTTQPKSPLSLFFSLGDKVTKGDPVRKMDFDYYMMWIIFLAFFFVFFGNLYNFYKTGHWGSIGWALFGLAIMWFQYFNLKNIWTMRKYQKELILKKDDKDNDDKIESPKEMLGLFK